MIFLPILPWHTGPRPARRNNRYEYARRFWTPEINAREMVPGYDAFAEVTTFDFMVSTAERHRAFIETQPDRIYASDHSPASHELAPTLTPNRSHPNDRYLGYHPT
jgi:hypothetical protein